MTVRRIYLASESERRIQILRRLGVEFTVLKPKAVEVHRGEPKFVAVSNALSKARSVVDAVDQGFIIAADTTVAVDGAVLGKPKDGEDAKRMLRMLSGRWHTVLTGLAVITVPERLEYTSVEETRVKFKRLSSREVEFYVATGEPFGKAGGYAIQGYASLFVDRVEGCYFNVVGLPVRRLYELMRKVGVDLLDYISIRPRGASSNRRC